MKNGSTPTQLNLLGDQDERTLHVIRAAYSVSEPHRSTLNRLETFYGNSGATPAVRDELETIAALVGLNKSQTTRWLRLATEIDLTADQVQHITDRLKTEKEVANEVVELPLTTARLREEVKNMGYTIGQSEPIICERAILRVESAEVEDAKFPDSNGNPQKHFLTKLRTISGAGVRNGETFWAWWTFRADIERFETSLKVGQLLDATLESATDVETLDELAELLVGKKFAAKLGASENGKHTRVIHDHIWPVEDTTADDGESDLDELPM